MLLTDKIRLAKIRQLGRIELAVMVALAQAGVPGFFLRAALCGLHRVAHARQRVQCILNAVFP